MDTSSLRKPRLLVGLLFSTLDTSIVATSLVTISQDLNDFINAPWIVLAYLLTYMSKSLLKLFIYLQLLTQIKASPFVYPN
jgi:MFS family permease